MLAHKHLGEVPAVTDPVVTETIAKSPVPTSWTHFAPAVIAVATGTVLFGPAALLSRLGLLDLLNRYRPVIGVICLLSAAILLVAQLAPLLLKAGRRGLRTWWWQRKGRTHLHDLTRSEKNLLKQYVSRATGTLVLDPSTSATSALLVAGVICRATELDDKALGLAFNIQPWALSYLRNNPQLLETSEVSSARPRPAAPGPAVGGRGRTSEPLG